MPKYLDNALSALKGFVHNFAKTSRHLLEKQEPGVNNFEKTSQCQKIGLLRTVNYVMKSYRCYDKSDVNILSLFMLYLRDRAKSHVCRISLRCVIKISLIIMR